MTIRALAAWGLILRLCKRIYFQGTSDQSLIVAFDFVRLKCQFTCFCERRAAQQLQATFQSLSETLSLFKGKRDTSNILCSSSLFDISFPSQRMFSAFKGS